MIIPLTSFTGMVLGIDPSVIQANASQACTNIDFTKGTLSGLGANTATAMTLPWNIKGGFVYSEADGSEKMYSFPYDVDAIRSPVAQDDHKRFYWTQDNAGAKDFRFARVADNPLDYVTTSYKVGVVGDSAFSITGAELGVSLSLVPNDPPVSLSEISNSTTALWIVDASGAKLKDITSNVASFTGVGAATAHGWHRQYQLTLLQSLADYRDVSVSATVYTPESARVFYGAGSSEITVNLWRNSAGVVKYIVPSAPASISGWSSLVGSQVNVFRGSWESNDGGFYLTPTEPIGAFWVKSTTGLSADNDAVPVNFNAISVTTSFPEGATLAISWSFDHNDQHHSALFTTKLLVSDVIDIGQGISGTLQEGGDALTWYLNFTFGGGSDYETRSYYTTFVNQLGEESAPTGPTEVTLQATKEIVRLKIDGTLFAAKFAEIAAAADRYPLHGLRLYRSVGGAFFYVGTMIGDTVPEIPGESYLTSSVSEPGFWIFDDTVTDAALGDACTTEGYVKNNSELSGLQGLTPVYNGIIAAFKKNEVWLCEPYMPWAWKRANVVTLPHKIVDLLPYEQGVLVFTDLKTYYMSGQSPSDFVPSELPGEYPCLNKNASINVEGKAMFVSTDGPAYINGMQVVIDQVSMTRDRWREILNFNSANGGDIRLVHYGHRVLAYFGGALAAADLGSPGGLMIDVANPNWTFVSVAPKFAMHVPANSFTESADHLAYVTGNQWYLAFNGSTSAEWNWVSKEFLMARPTNFGAFQVFGTGNLRVKIKADDLAPYSVDISLGASGRSGAVFRLPAGFLATRWTIELIGLSDFEGERPEVSKFLLSTLIGELQNV